MLVQRLLHDNTAGSSSEDAAFAAKLEEAYLNHEFLPEYRTVSSAAAPDINEYLLAAAN